jgi:predicted porin
MFLKSLVAFTKLNRKTAAGRVHRPGRPLRPEEEKPMRTQFLRLVGGPAVTVATLLLAAPQAGAVDVAAGDWKLGISGFASGYLQVGLCAHTDYSVAGGFACNTGPGGDNRSSVSNGLGVGHFGISAATEKGGWDIGGTGEIWSGINSTSGGKTGFGETSPSLRQSYVFFGSKNIGTFKAGRMFGVFASDAIGNDMSLAGVGSGAAGISGQVGNSTLGRIGTGYIFADFFPQIQYVTPYLHGFQLVASVIQAFDAVPLTDINKVQLVEHPIPGFMGKASFDWKGTLGGRAWVSGWVQNAASSTSPAQFSERKSITASAVDVGARLDFHGLALLGYFFAGDGVGSTAPMRDGVALVDGSPAKRRSDGYFGQLTYQLAGLKLGASYGACDLKLAPGEMGAEHLVKTNSSVIGGAYYTIGSVVTIAAEWTHTTSRNHVNDTVADNSVALGASAGF